ncbi:Ldh family oxidoreductase [Roseomonas alkaliterrae]|uniref:(2R)-3-sulfolactate dehydrogenase (NADP+) n=1 Tax=Neoroseomonas alkaliterrae TaxID=1452450 RepID=A0A840Y9N0_9PROT|nr:Ldh family oxidoreductase [Neoroseomonas alkaliterrae]MBB5690723.1 (2R)-3-sulfolactate dehydrogenase (NADP+) [Neoroseomonas alkaliterrae]MBR0677337.1 Ldh family oxidoreductase [Neoroseomonas alkaliterrae]
MRLSLTDAEALARAALAAAGASAEMAARTAEALVQAEAAGQAGHGLSRVPQYAAFLRNGRADGAAVPRIVNERGGAVLVDARHGLAYPALALAEAEAAWRARAHGVAFAGVTNSHHSGAMGLPVARLARQGLVALAFTNSPAAMPVPGGRRPLMGTNPVAAAFPRRGAPPLLVDMALSEVARGKIMVAAKEGRPIPEGWALDAEGRPTTDAQAALSGAMLAMGGTKGALLAMVVELLCCALTGAAFGFEADSFFQDEGNRPRLGQALLVVDSGALAGAEAFAARIEAFVAAMAAEDGVRLPGSRREALLDEARRSGLDVPEALHARLIALAAA